MTETILKEKIKGKDGRFVKGQKANPTGRNGYTTIAPLLKALKKQGKKRGQDFWDMVASRAWMSDTLLVAILKKILPDQVDAKVTGEVDLNVFIKAAQLLREKELNGTPITSRLGAIN